MDQFGVFTESFGLKPQGKSAPMAASKQPASSNGGQFGINLGFGSKSSSVDSWNSNSPNGLFGSTANQKTQNYGGMDGYDDLFGGFPKFSDDRTTSKSSSFDYDSIFGGSNNSNVKNSAYAYDTTDDIFGGISGLNSSASARKDDVFASFASNAGFDDLLGNFGGVAVGVESKSYSQNGSRGAGKGAAGLDDWIHGFVRSIPSKNGANIQTSQPRKSTSSTSMILEDPFVVLESTSTSAYSSSELFSDPLQETSNLKYSGGTKLGGASNASPTLRPPPKRSQVVKPVKVKSSPVSAIDELEDFAMGRAQNNYNEEKSKTSTGSKKATNGVTGVRERQNTKSSRYKEAEDAAQENQQKSEDDLESFFSMGTRSRSVPRSRTATSAPNRREPDVAQRTSSGPSTGIKKASSATNLVDDLSSVFGASPIFGEFEEVDGESEERRRARLGRLQRTQERAAKALADMNQRDIQTQREQDERHRIAEVVDIEIKHWAAGKETNMRALLSSLHYVLWPECGWQPVSLTDMITSTSVKKVYRKATLCIHPDKVQQKGATLQQKYTAEKVFDILKEAWNKFSSEELS